MIPNYPLLRVGLARDRRANRILARRPRRFRVGWLGILGLIGFGAALGFLAGTAELEFAEIEAEGAGRAYLFADVLKIHPGVALEACATDAECEAADLAANLEARR